MFNLCVTWLITRPTFRRDQLSPGWWALNSVFSILQNIYRFAALSSFEDRDTELTTVLSDSGPDPTRSLNKQQQNSSSSSFPCTQQSTNCSPHQGRQIQNRERLVQVPEYRGMKTEFCSFNLFCRQSVVNLVYQK